MRSFGTLAFLALPLFSTVFAGEPASPTKQVEANSIYASAQDAFQDLLNALPEESLQAALSGLKDFQKGVFESHHRGVEHVHDNNPALATKLIVAAVRDLKKRQAGTSNGTTPQPPSPPPQTSAQLPPTPESSAAPPPPQQSSAAPPPVSSADRPVVVPVEATTTDSQGRTVVQTTSVLSQVTASVEVTIVRTNAQGSAVTTTENRPAVVKTTTDSAGRTTVTTSAARFAPTAGEVLTATNAQGSTFLTTYTPGGGKISSVKLITTTGADGKPSTITSYAFVDPAEVPKTSGGDSKPTQTTGKPSLQTGAANKNFAVGYAMVGGALALFV
ncbi:uncharacterized protein K460DRAFT_55822 [Cucurbitaria berberidis CBS 394.84]|uniref:Uncharacterized protein n=1 Tax=Cucurbitaria berberidis CBS 394.84 TaxID=1168544 RepID=A0A9P4GKY5_9PLEO|nr:uncharacterized protein K460DRAFT_55822 [Cucurbitaria berberidis CBS 394.84]KAF1847246.1 hypothetical protein K460DRAFT_55822 [Cucurbitaria berberidis CBS 394.84]